MAFYGYVEKRSEPVTWSASHNLCPVMLTLLRGECTARLGSVTVLAQQLLKKIAPPLDDAQNELVAVSVSRGQMPGVHKAMNVAFGFKQRLFGCAFVDAFSVELPSLSFDADRVVRKFWCVDHRVEIVGFAGCAQGGFSE
ncbi:hypothetical protein HX788_21735 [Pseudomonas edaphica]|uniref:Uncharacterized protein n=1 Tax=Pseudomonas edaphica TaxID=2006980 RepID=A0A7Y8E841_9PSED|nr:MULTISPECIES: hypothetical protein [Pseudomonas]MBI6947595.1 hypothetical protein [Pseudomonas koreensis]NWC47142.1 hypothetical protein [Pseudomonas sp. IPO3747]NWE09732.1 hypothetical protein [Pseudomonas edaphica]NWE80806.1 hypothetical protein [Pseudomonas edaphica]